MSICLTYIDTAKNTLYYKIAVSQAVKSHCELIKMRRNVEFFLTSRLEVESVNAIKIIPS